MKTIPAKSILQRASSNGTWFGADYNMNLYRGCTHGCIYCDSRSECYKNPDFDTVYEKEDALFTLERELRQKKKIGVVGIGAMSDTYGPHENEAFLTRGALELLAKYGFGLSVDTKSNLIARDAKLIKEISDGHSAIAKLTITTTDDKLSKVIEPGAPVSSTRFATVRELSNTGVFTGVLFSPVLPFITDTEENVVEMVELAKENGASFIYTYFGVTMRDIQQKYFFDKLDRHFSGMKARYLQAYHGKYYCSVPSAKALSRLFKSECKRHGLLYRMDDIIDAYKEKNVNAQLTMNI